MVRSADGPLSSSRTSQWSHEGILLPPQSNRWLITWRYASFPPSPVVWYAKVIPRLAKLSSPFLLRTHMCSFYFDHRWRWIGIKISVDYANEDRGCAETKWRKPQGQGRGLSNEEDSDRGIFRSSLSASAEDSTPQINLGRRCRSAVQPTAPTWRISSQGHTRNGSVRTPETPLPDSLRYVLLLCGSLLVLSWQWGRKGN
jgi:hypothetical protein